MTTLEEVISPDRTVTVNGKTYSITEPDAFGYQLAVEAQQSNDMKKVCAIIARCLGLTVDDVFGSADKVGFPTSEVPKTLNKIIDIISRVGASAAPFSEPAGETQTVQG